MTSTGAAPVEKFALSTSRHFPEWLAATGGSLAFTTYQASKVFFIGAKPDGKLSIFERTFARSMGLGASADGRALVLATQHQIYRFDDILPRGATSAEGFDAVYAPHASWITGDLDAHDIGFGADGRPIFVNTLFGCIATVSEGHSFKPLWRPKFLSKLAAEDRCHLNGMAMPDGAPTHVTAVSQSDVADGWRDRRRDGGVVIDVASGEVMASGLSMPHSPRWYDGKLWLLNSGTGEFGHVDPATGGFVPVAFCPGYARGLTFTGPFAVIGLSLPREGKTFTGLALDEALVKRDTAARCGLAVIDTRSGDMTDWVRIEGVVTELYDVVALPGIRRPSAIGLKGEEIKRVISIDS